MLAGHYSAAFLAKAVEPRVPLWVLAVAAQLLDVIWALWALALELLLLLGSAWLCARRMGAPAGRGISRLVAALAGIQLALTFGQPPVGATAVPVIALLLFGIVAWACARIDSGWTTAR